MKAAEDQGISATECLRREMAGKVFEETSYLSEFSRWKAALLTPEQIDRLVAAIVNGTE